MMGKQHRGSDRRDSFQFIRMEPDQDRVVAIAAHNSIIIKKNHPTGDGCKFLLSDSFFFFFFRTFFLFLFFT